MINSYLEQQLIPTSAAPSTEKQETFDILNQTPNVRYHRIDGKLYRTVYTSQYSTGI